MKDQEAREDIQRLSERISDVRVDIRYLERKWETFNLLLEHLDLELKYVDSVDAHYILVQKGDKQ